MSPEIAASLGISISFQHPAILDDLSVLENLQVALPASVFAGKSAQVAAAQMLDAVGLHVPLRTRADALTVAQKHLLEIAKALAIKPKILMLDEPTASLDQDSTEMLFERIRGVVKTGTSVIYITHRLAELRQIAQRVTVLRDGRVRGGGLVNEIGDAELLGMIVGRTLGSAFPPKSERQFERGGLFGEIAERQRIQRHNLRSGAGSDRRRRRRGRQRPVRIDAGACRAFNHPKAR